MHLVKVILYNNNIGIYFITYIYDLATFCMTTTICFIQDKSIQVVKYMVNFSKYKGELYLYCNNFIFQ